MGSHIISGRAKALIIRTGRSTEFGKISDKLRIRQPETDFEKGIRRFGYMLMEITLVLVILIFAINVILHKPALDFFIFSCARGRAHTPASSRYCFGESGHRRQDDGEKESDSEKIVGH
jgi:Mg2+-importing ATPase